MVAVKDARFQLALIVAAVLLLADSTSYGQVGNPLGSVTFAADCGSRVGVGITFDGTNLWYSCYDSKLTTNLDDLYKANPKTGAVLASYDIGGGLGAIAYDATRNVIWAGEGGGFASNVGVVIKIPLDSNKNVSGPYQVAFPVPQAYNSPVATTGTTQDIVDGLAIDTVLANTLYVHYDFANEIAKYDAGTGAFLGFIPEAPGIQNGAAVMTNSPIPGCVVSGLAIGGDTLFEASDYCDQVWAVDKNTLAPLLNFTIQPFVPATFDEKAITCDTKTFVTDDALWVKGAYSPQQAYAFSILPGSCGVGGQLAVSVPQPLGL